MTAEELATQMRDRLLETGSIDAKILTKAEVDLHTDYVKTHALIGVSCPDKRVPDFFRDDYRFRGVLDRAKDFLALPYGEHTILIFTAT